MECLCGYEKYKTYETDKQQSCLEQLGKTSTSFFGYFFDIHGKEN